MIDNKELCLCMNETGIIKYKRVIIVCAGIQQRVAKTAHSFVMRGIPVTILAEENSVKGLFDNYLNNIEFIQINAGESKLKRTPIGSERKAFIKENIVRISNECEKLLIIARDVNYGYIVGSILKDIKRTNITFLVDIADNYDLLYDSYENFIKKIIFKMSFQYITRKAIQYSDGIITVCPINKPRLMKKFPEYLKGKPIFVLRNVPLEVHYINNDNKIQKSFVYVGKVDEISRDLLFVVKKLLKLPEYTLHFYSADKKEALDKIRRFSIDNNMEERVVFHDRVPYDQLAAEISKYRFGLVAHKRRLITDFTLPNKLYDYRSSGVIAIMSDCPSLVEENNEFGLGLIYSKEKDDFVDIVNLAESFSFDETKRIPSWDEEFQRFFQTLP